VAEVQPVLLNHDVIAAGRPDRWLYVLHGIFGAGRNWASPVRRVVRRRPEWGAVLVDLRQHGGSQGFEPPHTVAAAAADVAALAASLERPAAAVLGHSFGGKVALAFLRDHGVPGLQIWVVDSTPAARDAGGGAWAMLQLLRRVPVEFASRADGIAALEAEGVATPLAQWMATNLEESGGSYRWRIDLEDMEALMCDFFDQDLWPLVERPPPATEVHLLKAEESSVLEGEALARAAAAAAGDDRVHLHRLAGGHWLNADNPETVEDLLVRHLP
jgi:esterase